MGTETENTKEIDKAFEIDTSKYNHLSIKHKLISYPLYGSNPFGDTTHKNEETK